MAMINYADKVALNSNSGIADINKVKADDMNELKNVFNNQVAQGWYKTGINPTFTFVSYNSETLTGVVSSDLDMTPYLNVGMKVKFTQSSAIKYGIITAITSTQLTLFLGTDYSINNSAISNTYFSMLKAPYGFPLNPDKWRVYFKYELQYDNSSAVNNTWYTFYATGLLIPIGIWNVSIQFNVGGRLSSAGRLDLEAALSTSLASVSDNDLKAGLLAINVTNEQSIMVVRQKTLVLATPTRYYPIIRGTNASNLIGLFVDGRTGGRGSCLATAICAYL